LLSVELACAAVSKGREKGMYPSDEMDGSALPKGSRTKETLTMSFGGSWFCVVGLVCGNHIVAVILVDVGTYP